ncbi:MAG: hypothetical protein LH632_02025, partial [Rhodoferax sp.]|nr:hypothetical protein [Rhodoferax sp.]
RVMGGAGRPPPRHRPARVLDAGLGGGEDAAAKRRGGVVGGARADALVLDTAAPALLGLPPSHHLDALVFAGADPAFAEVLVAGKVVMRHGQHLQQQTIAARYTSVMQELWGAAA